MKRLLLYTILPAMLTAIIGFYAGQSYIQHRIALSAGRHADATFTSLRRAPYGSLMLTSVPTGASISVNHERRAETTPAELLLTPGSYMVVVEKDGLSATLPVELHTGATKFMKVTLLK